MSDSLDTGVVPSIEKDTNTSALSLDSAKNTVVNISRLLPIPLPPNKLSQLPMQFKITPSLRTSPTVCLSHLPKLACEAAANPTTIGPVATNVKDQTAKTQSELSSLAASRTTPGAPAATGQQLTHYHSFFTRLLSWEHPRASGIAFASVVAFIFAVRYLNILRYGLKLTSWTLGATVLAEAAGKAAFGKGLITQIRPRKYYTIPKDSIDRLTGDITELINFFVIESQRIVFAENVFASAVAFLGAFISYYLIKIVPFWGLTLLSTSLVFLTPLIYKTNKEVIDAQIANVSSIVNQQTEQVKQLASHHAARATETTKAYASDYSAKAQEIIGNARGRSSSPSVEKKKPAYKSEDFPTAPKEGFKSESLHENEPLIST